MALCDSFDPRYSTHSLYKLWGQGVYFAKDASFSFRYAHKLGNNFFQLILGQVITGNAAGYPQGYLSKGQQDGEATYGIPVGIWHSRSERCADLCSLRLV